MLGRREKRRWRELVSRIVFCQRGGKIDKIVFESVLNPRGRGEWGGKKLHREDEPIFAF